MGHPRLTDSQLGCGPGRSQALPAADVGPGPREVAAVLQASRAFPPCIVSCSCVVHKVE